MVLAGDGPQHPRHDTATWRSPMTLAALMLFAKFLRCGTRSIMRRTESIPSLVSSPSCLCNANLIAVGHRAAFRLCRTAAVLSNAVPV
jgi:hypothetical protein